MGLPVSLQQEAGYSGQHLSPRTFPFQDRWAPGSVWCLILWFELSGSIPTPASPPPGFPMECGRAMGSEGAGLIHILLSLHSNRVTLDWLLSFSQPLWFCLSTGNSFSSFTDTTEVQRGDGSSGMDSIGKGAQRFFFPELVAIVSIVCVCVCVSEINDSKRLLYHDRVLVLPVNKNSVILNWSWIKFTCIL